MSLYPTLWKQFTGKLGLFGESFLQAVFLVCWFWVNFSERKRRTWKCSLQFCNVHTIRAFCLLFTFRILRNTSVALHLSCKLFQNTLSDWNAFMFWECGCWGPVSCQQPGAVRADARCARTREHGHEHMSSPVKPDDSKTPVSSIYCNLSTLCAFPPWRQVALIPDDLWF